jgi:DNA-binding winged helix-turn-helix (wHTH) protein/tetratricopeptide (TPR) repeat protein
MKSFGPFRLDVVNECVWNGEARIALMPKPFAVLRHLVEHAGRLVTHDELLGAIWPDTYVQPEVIRRYILEIRRALGDHAQAPRFIQTLPRRGYQFTAVVTDDETAAVAAGDAAREPRTFVGRAAALADLHRHLAAAREGRRRVVFVVGEPGIGKTSLVDAFQSGSAAAAGVLVARGQCVEGFGGKEPYYPLLEALAQLARGPSRDVVVDALTTNAPTWLSQLPSLVRPDHLATLQLEFLGATRERMVRELCEALEVISEKSLLLLILEDLHWVDRSTLDIISALARRREPAKLLVLATIRPADLILAESPLKALKQDLVVHRLSHEVGLERLHESDVADYVAAAFAPGDLPRGLAGVIHRHSDGNPLFMTAMLDHLAQRGVLAQTGGRWTMTVPLDEVDPGVPETLKQMLEAQLQHASDEEQRLLKCASVAGQHFTAWAVATMLPDEVSRVEEMCEALADGQQFLRRSDTRQLADGGSTPEYQFRHALYREILYRRLSHSQRIGFHVRLAEGLEALRSPVAPEMAGEIALHFEESRDYARAIRYLVLAAQTAACRCAHRQAVEVLEHARMLLPAVAGDQETELDLQTLERLGNAHYALGDMERSAEAYASMAARAAGAGRLAAQADALTRQSHPAQSIPFFLRAIEIDPGFAVAYVSLSRIYSNLGEVECAREYAKLAYDRRELVSERDRLSIDYQYHYEVTGDQARASQTLEVWKRSFPQEFQPANSLALIHNFLGRFDLAIEEGEEAVRRQPSHGYPYSNLAHAYRGAGRLDEARSVAERAVALDIETLPTRRLLYQLALMAGDDESAARHLEWARDRPREFDMIGARAQAAAWSGRVREARQLHEDAARMAESRHLPDVGTSHLASAATMEVAYGRFEDAVALARRVLARQPGYDPRLRAAMALALAMHGQEAEVIVNELAAGRPEHTIINAVLAPTVRAAIELGRGRPEVALERLEVTAPFELGFIAAFAPVYLRGQAYLMLGDGRRAAGEFQRILDGRGTDPFSPFHAVATIGVARAHALSGNIAASRSAYERFLAGWAGADSDVPVLLAARDESRRLERGTTFVSGARAGHA